MAAIDRHRDSRLKRQRAQMFSRQWWFISHMMRRLWFTATLYCLFGVVSALAAIWIAPYLPDDLPRTFGSSAVDSILSIIASSMLAVTTFSLTTLVSATSAAADAATPRATSLLLEDRTAQRALSTFLGAFLFSLVGLIALNTELYGERGRFVLFIATLVMVTLIVVTLLRWIDHLAGLGRMGETISRVEEAAQNAFNAYRAAPIFGATPWAPPAVGAIAIFHPKIGYLQHLDMATLSTIAEELDATLHVARRPGSHCDPTVPIAHLTLNDKSQTLEDDVPGRIASAFTIGNRRSFDQDPRFGLIALSEIGSKALSPGINDPGTAIDVLATLTRLMAADTGPQQPPEIVHARIHLADIAEDDLMEAAFMPISRDGAGLLEVAIRLQKSLSAISAHSSARPNAAARRMAASALARSRESLTFGEDRTRIEEEYARLFTSS
jgi:uncharacterized membrane protein